MGRRSLAVERRQQIIEATTRCLRRHGLAGATLERIAEESGMSRSHIRHYVGNREDLLLAVVRHLHERYDQAFAASVAEAAVDAKLAAVMDYLYGPEFTAPGDDNAVIRELLS
ncbi:TetR family transcriptional regulator, partial [Streptomyces sp. NPDC002896]|uniref:TetR/AcrR family transcriptional regulator n=1 Tax=Streptomyces sp. NPDC002896 TaxID=3154438 RepID=UPI0033227C03